MTKLELGTIISKVFALYYFFKALYGLMPTIMSVLFNYNETSMNEHVLFFVMIQVISPTIIFLLFWIGAEKIGKKIAGKDEQKNILNLKHEDLMVSIFVGFGCFLLYSALPPIVDTLSILFGDDEIRNRYIENNKMTKDITQSSLYFILSMYFIFGASGLQKIVFTLRNLGKR